jgi:hypothetical protein
VGNDPLLHRLRDWHQAGMWDRLHQLLLAELHATDHLD